VKLRDQGATKLISSSGGNAGLAISSVGSSLGMDVEVIVPESTKEVIITKIRSMGANVQVHGANWNAADELARSLVAADPKAEYVSPFDHPLLWEGHSTIIDELAAEMSPPSHLVVSVGGGGLLCGVLEGLARVKGWEKVAVVAVETNGAASFHGAWQSSPPARDYTIPSIDTIATSLGARRVTEAVLDRAVAHQGDFTSVLCTDEEVVDTLVHFAHDHKLLVEPACAASLALAYVPRLRQHLEGASHVVFEVCGGSAVSLELIEQWTSSKQA
jgi:L-serine/L-threonine ammonia-lyase